MGETDDRTVQMERSLIGCVLGTAVGDAIGLPFEGMSRRRVLRLMRAPLRHQLLLGHGMISDDTEHTCMVAQSLIVSSDDEIAFARQFSRRLRWWLLGLPAGIGLATLKATMKLWLGISPHRSGVFSAGNGPAMRSPILGAAFDDLEALRRFVRACTRITHTDPKAEYGALTVAVAAHLAGRHDHVEPAEFVLVLKSLLQSEPADELFELLSRVTQAVSDGETTAEFADSLGLFKGVTGYVYHTVPVAIHAWLANQGNLRAAVTDVIRCGGDTDSTAAIVGGIVGCGVGKEGIPDEWLAGLCDWPRSVHWIESLARQMSYCISNQESGRPPRLTVYAVLPRNLFFLLVVLAHGFRRLLPPY